MNVTPMSATPLSNSYLSWKDRTSEINDSISTAFQKIVANTKSQWKLYNGSDVYEIGGIKEHKLMRKIIQEASRETKDFYALDIGAGNYEWGQELAFYLNGKKQIPKDVTIHIIGIRGETNLNNSVTEIGQCKLYEFGQFQIESLMNEFEMRGLQLANKVDLVVSRWCIRHLADPLGTFTQAYDLLRPKTGYFLFDGFHFLHENESMRDKSLNFFNERMTRLCLETGAPFLTRFYNDGRSLDHFVVSKINDHPLHLQKQYLGIEHSDDGWQIGSKTVTKFKEIKGNDIKAAPLLWEGDYKGDKALYEYLKQKGLLHEPNLVWGPLEDKDSNKNTPPFHKAITEGNEEAIECCLQKGCDINESDAVGSTPLHLSIEHKNYKLFSQLLEKGALTKLFAKGCTPLHLAVQYDFEGCFITDLIAKKVNVNITSKWYRSTPLDHAIANKNIKAVELLLKEKAFVNSSNNASLDTDPTFSSIKDLPRNKDAYI